MTTPQPIEIFRPGRFTSVEGKTIELSLADLEATAAAYDAAREPAPLVKGHPALDAPAQGWVARLTVADGKLVAHPEDVEPSFADDLRAKRFRRVSAQLYPPAHPNSPSPEVWALKHVGFLGAASPGVRGLAPVSFAEDAETGAISFDQPQAEEAPVADTPTVTEDQTASFAEREAVLDTRAANLDAREAAIAEREAADAVAARDAIHQAHVSFAEGMIAGGKLKPFGKDKLVGLLDVLEANSVVSFGEAGELAPVDVFKEMLTAAEPFVSFGEAAPAEGEDKPVASFAAPPGFTVDAEALALHTKAHAHQAAHPELSYIEAVKAVS